jgi:hypothetical protein
MKIPYTESALRWHLESNILPQLSPKVVDNIIETCNKFNNGEIGLNDQIAPNAKCTVGEMFEDMKIDLEDTLDEGESGTKESRETKLMIIENFIEYFTTNEEERYKMKEAAFDYVKEDHVDEIEGRRICSI